MIRKSIKRHCFASSLLSLIYLLATPCMLAQGSAFTYQGKLTDSGNPANGNYDFQFKLFDSADFVTGNQVGTTITSLGVQVTNGTFTVQLDFGASVFPGASRFVEIAVRLAGSPNAFTVLSSRQPLTSAPYAVRSATAASADTATNATNASSAANSTNALQLGGIAASQYVVTTDPRLSDARPPTAGSGNYIQNRTSQQNATNFNISGNGTIGGRLTVSNVGIGTTNPARPLEIATGKMRLSDPLGDIEFTEVADVIAHATEANPVSTDPAFRVDVGTSLTRVFTVLNDGKVGIGTANPNQGKLHVEGGGNVGVFGVSSSGVGVEGTSSSWLGVKGFSTSFVGVRGDGGIYGVQGTSGSGTGVRGYGGNYGVAGDSNSGVGVLAGSQTGNLIEGWVLATRRFHITNSGTYVAGSDFAEALPARGDRASYEPGDVLVASADASATVDKTSRPYDARLVGVYSTRPGMLGADKNGTSRVDENELPVAIVGIVPTKVSTENGPIQAGDLLTTSATPGYAMKASPGRVGRVRVYRTGTILGKALEPLKEGRGVIKVLVTLR